jgi:hypothetical protein
LARIKIGAKVVRHGRYIAFQMAEVAIPRHMFQEILRLIAELRPLPPPAPALGGYFARHHTGRIAKNYRTDRRVRRIN